jgi:hypothetical protein
VVIGACVNPKKATFGTKEGARLGNSALYSLLDTDGNAWREPLFRPAVIHGCENDRTGCRSSKQGAHRVRLQFGLQPDDARDLNRERGAEGRHFERLLV